MFASHALRVSYEIKIFRVNNNTKSFGTHFLERTTSCVLPYFTPTFSLADTEGLRYSKVPLYNRSEGMIHVAAV